MAHAKQLDTYYWFYTMPAVGLKIIITDFVQNEEMYGYVSIPAFM